MVAVSLGRSGLRVMVTITLQALLQLDLRSGRAVHVVFKTHACRVLAVP